MPSDQHIVKSGETNSDFSFWKWLFLVKGLARFLNWWLLFHIIIGVSLAVVVEVSIAEAANTVLLPLAGILIGLTFAWAGNAQALLQTEEIELFTRYREGGLKEYVFVFQLAVFFLLTTLVAWGLGGMQVFERECIWQCGPAAYIIAEAILYTFSSIALRECWHVVIGAQWLMLIRDRIRRAKNSSD